MHREALFCALPSPCSHTVTRGLLSKWTGPTRPLGSFTRWRPRNRVKKKKRAAFWHHYPERGSYRNPGVSSSGICLSCMGGLCLAASCGSVGRAVRLGDTLPRSGHARTPSPAAGPRHPPACRRCARPGRPRCSAHTSSCGGPSSPRTRRPRAAGSPSSGPGYRGACTVTRRFPAAETLVALSSGRLRGRGGCCRSGGG